MSFQVKKECNMILDRGSSVIEIDGHDSLSQQHHNAYEVFEKFIEKVKPDKVLEIGTGHGALTRIINLAGKKNNPNFKLLTLDVVEWDSNTFNKIRDEGGEILLENIFDEDYLDFNNDRVKDFISDNSKKVFICDGKKKIGEFNIFAKYMNVGDYIMAHDYVDTRENFLENYKRKIWNWHEISDNDLKDVCDEYNLVDFEKEMFSKIVWVCKIKQS